MTSKTFKHPFVYYELTDGILHMTYTPNLEIALEVAKEIVRSRLEFTEGKSYPILADIRKIKSADKEAREFFSSKEGVAGVTAGALLTGSGVSTFIGNFFLKISFIRTLIPNRLFTNKEKALKWLEKYK